MCKQPLSEKHADDSVCSFLCHRFQLRTYPIISLLSGRPGTGIPITGNASAFADPKQTLEQEAAQPRAQSLQLSQNFRSRPYYNGRMKFIGMLLLSHQKITITFSILPIYFYAKKHQLKYISDQSSPSILLLYCQEFSH